MMKNADMTEKSRTLWKLWNIHTKMRKEFLTYGNIEIEKKTNKFYRQKTPFIFFLFYYYFFFWET